MTVTKKEDNVFITPVGTVNFYTLDAPFGAHTAEFDEKGMVTNGKLGIRVTLDPTLAETKDLLKQLKGNVSIKEIVNDGKILVQLSAGYKINSIRIMQVKYTLIHNKINKKQNIVLF